jgi:hypothetical protein
MFRPDFYPSPSADRVRRHRQRQRGELPPLAVCPCGCQIRSAKTTPLCSRCWRGSPAGKEENRLRMQRARKAKSPQAET